MEVMKDRHQALVKSLEEMGKLTHTSFGESMRTLRSAIETTTPETFDASDRVVDSSNLMNRMVTTVNACANKRRQSEDELAIRKAKHRPETSMSLARMAALTRELPLEQFRGMLGYVPRLVNVVTLAQVCPRPSSTTTLPLCLPDIARRCPGAFFSPKRFAAVQLAFRSPRCRVLIFHTGKIVGTGCNSVIEARLATMLACQHMKAYAGVEVYVNNFEVVNTMGAVALQLTLDCERFQRAWSSMTMLDRSSFVGMTWRPNTEPVCIEIYSSGRANVSKARHYAQLLRSFSRLIPELLKYSSHKKRDEPSNSTEQTPETLSHQAASQKIYTARNLRVQNGLDQPMVPLGKKRMREEFDPHRSKLTKRTSSGLTDTASLVEHKAPTKHELTCTSATPATHATHTTSSSIWDGWTIA